MKNCPNCSAKLDGFLSSKFLIDRSKIDFINTFHVPKSEAYCSDCAGLIIKAYKSEIFSKKSFLNKYIDENIDSIPIVTTHSPFNWDYKILDIVSAQSVSGTGFLSEISSSWSDIVGGQSDNLANKISNGELICKNQLRYKTIMLGGNAVIATDIDYSEVGGGKGMLMVCMAGTAVDVAFNDDTFKDKKIILENLKTKSLELIDLNKIKFFE